MSRKYDVRVLVERPRKSRRKGKKNRKHGRNKKKCEAYRKAQKHEKSHVRRLLRHITQHPQDEQAKNALALYEGLLR